MTEVAPGGALPKPWTDLQNARKQRKTLREEIEKLNAACQAEDGSKHLVECEKCYPKSLSIIESAYTEPALKTWLTDRPGLKDDLKACIQTVMAGEANLDVIETRLEQEKNAWYRELLLASPDLLDVGDNDIRREDLLASLADPECHIDDIVNPMWESISKPDKWSDQLEAFIEKTSGADGDDAALRQIYADELFKNRTTGEAVAHAQPYLDAYEGNAGSAAQPLDEVLESLIRDISAGKSSGSQRTILRSRLDELSRAKTAFEQNKVTEAKGRSAAGVREAVVLTLLEPLPPCYTCEGEVKKTEVLSCSHCQIALQLAGEQGREKKKLTVFCSEDCLQKGQSKHEDEAHECAAKDKCTSLMTSSEDVDMNADTSPLAPVACTPCMLEKELTIYCSSECADANMADHRQDAHNVKTDPEDTTGTYKAMEDVAKMLEEATSGLKIAWH